MRTQMVQARNIAVIGTLDTKGKEIGFVRDLLAARGHRPVLIDAGIRGAPQVSADVTREAVAAAAGTTLDELLARGDKGAAVQAMARGLAAVVAKLRGEGRLDAALAIGGAQGSMIAAQALQELPVGVPKLLVSVIANGQTTFGPFVGTRDVLVMHSVADILGLNRLTRKVLTEAAGAIAGMAEIAGPEAETPRPTIALTMAGVTTAAAMRLREALDGLGYEVVAFHCNGIGAKAMEDMVEAGELDGIVDLSPHDVPDGLFGGIMPAHADRLRAPVRHGVPLVFVPGAADFILYGPFEQLSTELKARPLVRHNAIHTHVRATRAEMAAVGRFVGERLRGGRGSSRVVVPMRGFSQLNVAGGPLHDPEADSGFLAGLRAALAGNTQSGVEIIEADLHINDETFADMLANQIDQMVAARRQSPREQQS